MSATRRLLVGIVLAVAAATAGCSAGASDAGGASSSSAVSGTPTTGSASGSPPSSDTASPPRCASTTSSSGMPPDAVKGTLPDVDGDGQPDTLWISAGGPDRSFGVTTSAGASFAAPIDSGSPIPASALGVQPQPDGAVYVLVSDGRLATLYVVDRCGMGPVLGPDSQPFRFDLGFAGNGTGVGCVEVNGEMQLVGLLADPQAGTVKRTVIELSGASASIGASETVDADAAGLELAHQITCGERTMARDGVQQPQS